jgi:hypothetical protein
MTHTTLYEGRTISLKYLKAILYVAHHVDVVEPQ